MVLFLNILVIAFMASLLARGVHISYDILYH